MSRWSDAGERNQAAVRKRAGVILNDERYRRLRTRGGLLAVVIVYVLAGMMIAPAWLLLGQFGGLASIALWFFALIGLRIAVRTQADLPDEVLDERMRSERDEVYLPAYRVVGSCLTLVALAGVLASNAGGEDGFLVDYELMSAGFWTLFALLIGTPSLVMAMAHRDNASTKD